MILRGELTGQRSDHEPGAVAGREGSHLCAQAEPQAVWPSKVELRKGPAARLGWVCPSGTSSPHPTRAALGLKHPATMQVLPLALNTRSPGSKPPDGDGW